MVEVAEKSLLSQKGEMWPAAMFGHDDTLSCLNERSTKRKLNENQDFNENANFGPLVSLQHVFCFSLQYLQLGSYVIVERGPFKILFSARTS